MSKHRKRRRANQRAVEQVSHAGNGASTFEAPATVVVPPQPPELMIREPVTTADLAALHMLMLLQGQECAPFTVNTDKVMAKLISAVQAPDRHIMLMAVLDGKLVGFLNLERTAFFYTEQEALTDFGYYVLPQHRGGDVGPSLRQAAIEIAEHAELPLFLFINNPNRRRGPRPSMERTATLHRFVPSGSVLAFNMKETGQNVLRQ